MPYAPQGVTVEPNAQTVVVTITEQGGGTPLVYTDKTAQTTIAMPATISGRTTFFLTDKATFTVSCKVGGQENANGNGGTAQVDLTGGGFASVGVSVPVETPGVTSGTFAPLASGAQAFAALAHKLKRDRSNTSIVVLGDSTGVDLAGDDRWFGRWAASFAPLWPKKTIRYHPWDDTAAQYDTLATAPLRTLQTGSGTANAGGPFAVDLYNASIGGTILPSPLGVNSGLTTTLNGALTAGATSVPVAANPWNAGAVQYVIQVEYEQMLVTAGQGTTTLTVTRGYNGTTAAAHSTALPVSLAPRWVQMVREIQPDVVFVNYGFNEYDPTAKPGEMFNRLLALVEHLRMDCPDAQVIIIGQPPKIATTGGYASDGLQELRAAEAESFAAQRGYGFIDFGQVVVDAGTLPTWYTNNAGVPVDGVHPSSIGAAAEAAEVLRHTAYSVEVQPRMAPPSLLSEPAESLLVGANMQEWGSGGFSSWARTSLSAAKTLQTGQNLAGYAIRLTSSTLNTAGFISQGPGNLPAFKGQWVSALVRMFVPVGASSSCGIVGISDGVNSLTNGTPSTEGQGMWRYVIVRLRLAKTSTQMTMYVYAESSTSAAAGQYVDIDFATLVLGPWPRPVPARTQTAFVTDVKLGNGKKWRGIEGNSAASQGLATLVAGTVTVTTTAIATGDRVRLTGQSTGAGVASWGDLRVTTITNATSFVITSSSATDTSTVFWEIVGAYT